MANKKLAMEVYNVAMDRCDELHIDYNDRSYYIEWDNNQLTARQVDLNDGTIVDTQVYIFKDKQDILDNYIIQGKPLKNIMGQLDNIWS